MVTAKPTNLNLNCRGILIFMLIVVLYLAFQDWSLTHSKGAFFFEEEDGSLVNHIYRLDVPKDTSAWITIEPFTLRPGGGD